MQRKNNTSERISQRFVTRKEKYSRWQEIGFLACAVQMFWSLFQQWWTRSWVDINDPADSTLPDTMRSRTTMP